MIDEAMDDGYSLALADGAVYQGGAWNSGDGILKMAVFRTTDDGTSWDRAAMGTMQGAVRAIAVSPADPQIIFAGGYFYDDTYVSWSQLFSSSDGGASWNESSPSDFNQMYEGVRSILFDAWDPDILLLCTERAVYRSTDAGGSWLRTATSTYNYCLLGDPGIQDCYYLGSESGVSRSTDGGLTWDQFGDGLDTRVNCLTIDTLNRQLYAGTEGAGVCRLSVLVTGVDGPDDEGLPVTMVLGQNYPNPFNPMTRIDLGVPEEGWYRLAVYNTLGQEVAVLFNGPLSPGMRSIDFDASRLSSGAYLYRLTGPAGSLIRKMLLMR